MNHKVISTLIVVITAFMFISGCSQDSGVTTESQQNTSTEKNGSTLVKTNNSINENYTAAINLYDQGKLEQAMDLFEKCRLEDPKNGLYDFYIGNVYQKMSQTEQALQSYKSAIEKTPQLIEAYNNMAAILMAAQNYDQALEIADKGLSQKSDFLDLKFKKAQMLYVKQKYNESILLLKELAADPIYFEANRFLGLNYIKLNDRKMAIKYLTVYVKQAPDGVPSKEKVKQIVAELQKQ